jgi:hypothetical protein
MLKCTQAKVKKVNVLCCSFRNINGNVVELSVVVAGIVLVVVVVVVVVVAAAVAMMMKSIIPRECSTLNV